MSSTNRKTASLSLDAELLLEAQELAIDLSRAAETGIASAIKAEKERRWEYDHAEAIKAEQEYIAKHGLPLAKYRQF